MPTPRVLLYDSELIHRATLGAGGQTRQVGDRFRFAARGEYVVFRVEEDEGEPRYHAVAVEGWDDERQAPRVW